MVELAERVGVVGLVRVEPRPEGQTAQEVDRDHRVEGPLAAQPRGELVGLQRRELGDVELDHLRRVRDGGEAIGLGARAASVDHDWGS